MAKESVNAEFQRRKAAEKRIKEAREARFKANERFALLKQIEVDRRKATKEDIQKAFKNIRTNTTVKKNKPTTKTPKVRTKK